VFNPASQIFDQRYEIIDMNNVRFDYFYLSKVIEESHYVRQTDKGGDG